MKNKVKVNVDVDLINKINIELNKGESLNTLESSGALGCVRKTFVKKAKELGYKLDRNINQFVKVTSDVTSSVADDEQVTLQITPSVTIEELDRRLKIVEEMLSSNTNITLAECEHVPANKIVTRSVKVNGDVMKEFAILVKEQFPQYNQQDILTYILKQFINQYK